MVVTTTFSASGPPMFGVYAVICVSLSTVKDAGFPSPKVTEVAPVKFCPVMVTAVPPDHGPFDGESWLTTGAATNVYWSAGEVAPGPSRPLTVTSTVPADVLGVTAVMVLSPTTLNEEAATVPKSTAVAPRNPTPEIVRDVPP